MLGTGSPFKVLARKDPDWMVEGGLDRLAVRSDGNERPVVVSLVCFQHAAESPLAGAEVIRANQLRGFDLLDGLRPGLCVNERASREAVGQAVAGRGRDAR